MADAQLLLLGTVTAIVPARPDFGLRTGAVISAVLLLLRLRSIRLHRADVFAITYAALAVASITWARNDSVTTLGVKNTVACVVLFLTVRTVTRRRRDLRGLALGLLVGCGIGLWLLWQENPFTRQLRFQYDNDAARVGIEGLNYNALAYAFATGAAVAVLLWLTVEDTQRRRIATVASAATLIAIWGGVLLNGTRGAVVAMALLLAWLLASMLNPRRAFHWLVGVVLVANAAVFAGWLDSWLRTSTARSVRETGDLNGRLQIWPFAREQFWNHPFLGHGVDGVIALPGNPLDIAAHNALLDIGVGLGFAGIALFVATIWESLAETGAWRSPRRYRAVGAFVAVSAPVTLSGYWSESPVFWIALALFSRLPVVAGQNATAEPVWSRPQKDETTGP